MNSLWSGFLFLTPLTTWIIAQRKASCPELGASLSGGAWGDSSLFLVTSSHWPSNRDKEKVLKNPAVPFSHEWWSIHLLICGRFYSWVNFGLVLAKNLLVALPRSLKSVGAEFVWLEHRCFNRSRWLPQLLFLASVPSAFQVRGFNIQETIAGRWVNA